MRGAQLPMKEYTSVTLRIDKDMKKQADELFEELGLNFNAAIKIFLYKCLRERAIPFKISLDKSQQAHLIALFAKELDIKNLSELRNQKSR